MAPTLCSRTHACSWAALPAAGHVDEAGSALQIPPPTVLCVPESATRQDCLLPLPVAAVWAPRSPPRGGFRLLVYCLSPRLLSCQPFLVVSTSSQRALLVSPPLGSLMPPCFWRRPRCLDLPTRPQHRHRDLSLQRPAVRPAPRLAGTLCALCPRFFDLAPQDIGPVPF